MPPSDMAAGSASSSFKGSTGFEPSSPNPADNIGKMGYWEATKSLKYSFIAALPLLALYEVFILLVNDDRMNQIRVGADIWIKQTLALVGVNGIYAIGALVLVAAVFVLVRERSRSIPLKASYFGWMIGESTLYAMVVALLVSITVGSLFQNTVFLFTSQASQPGTGMMLVLSIGAGLYEELIFRVVLVGGMFFGLKQIMKKDMVAYLVAAFVGALIFSAVHYMGPLGDPFAWPSFTFRFLFGLALNGIFLVRGFGVAAWTHAIYDLLVVTQILG